MRNPRRSMDLRPVLFLASITLFALLLVTTAFGDIAYGFPQGPPDGMAGNPPALNTCATFCHFDYEVNSGDGDLSVLGLPAQYVPGNVYPLLVKLQDPEQSRWGFEITVLDNLNQAAGVLAVTDPLTTQISDNPADEPDYVKHVYDGTFWGTLDGPVQWPLEWTAPSLPAVTFYVAGNASNGNDDPGGDYIYTRQYTLTAASTATDLSSWGKIKSLYAR